MKKIYILEIQTGSKKKKIKKIKIVEIKKILKFIIYIIILCRNNTLHIEKIENVEICRN